MTRPVRVAGVVVVAALAVAIPALASGHDRAAVQAVAARALLCPGPTTPGNRQHFVVPATHTTSGRHGRRAGHAHSQETHSEGTPADRCARPCGWIVTEPAGATGRARLTPPLRCEPRLVCVPAGANRARVFCHPIPCILSNAHGNGAANGAAPTTGATFHCTPIPCPIASLTAPSGATGATVHCPPLPCALPYLEPPTRAAPTTGATLLCPPIPCLISNAGTHGRATGAIACPLPPICPLAGAASASVCPAPCVYAGGSAPTGPTGTTATCPPIPICPPEPRTTANSTLPALYSCPEIAAGSATGD